MVYYITHQYSLKTTKGKITCEELYEKIIPSFAEYATKMREEGKGNYYMENNYYKEEDDIS